MKRNKNIFPFGEDKKISYRAAGVDVDKGRDFVDFIRLRAKQTERLGVPVSLGGFSTFLDPRATGYDDPLIVVTTDGVGTKVKLAVSMGLHYGIGVDVVGMCVNDLLVCGAEPFGFLDYYGYSRVECVTSKGLVEGMVEGCKECGCALIGGETAEMPGMYAQGEYEVVGFAIGFVERNHRLPLTDIRSGDRVLGLKSNGVHANGFSLIRHIVERGGFDVREVSPFEEVSSQEEVSLGESLLRPTRLYVKPVLETLRTHRAYIKALVHITGGGLKDNIPLVLPEDKGVTLDVRRWEIPEVFRWIARVGGVSAEEMFRTFNCGIGMVVIVSEQAVEGVVGKLREQGEEVFEIGFVRESTSSWPRVIIEGASF